MSIFQLYNLPKPRGYSEKGKFIYSCPYCGKEKRRTFLHIEGRVDASDVENFLIARMEGSDSRRELRRRASDGW